MKAHAWIGCDGVLSALSDQGAAANPLPQGGHSSAAPQLPFLGYACPSLQEGATEAKQLSQRARSQLRAP